MLIVPTCFPMLSRKKRHKLNQLFGSSSPVLAKALGFSDSSLSISLKKINPVPLRKQTGSPFPLPTGLPGRSSTTWLKGERNRLANNLNTWWMATQAKQQGTLLSPAGSLVPPMLFIFSIIFTTWEHPRFFTGAEWIWHLDCVQKMEGSGLVLIEGMVRSADNSNYK